MLRSQYRPRLAGGKLRCEKCQSPARGIQVTGGRGWGYPVGPASRVRLVCRDHGFGGYPIPLRELAGDGLTDWLRHLAEKVWRADVPLRALMGPAEHAAIPATLGTS